MYKMTTIYGTRIRTEPNTAASVITSVLANVTVEGNELFTASEPLQNANGVYQKVGDKWLKITYNGVTGWMAYIHMGEPICKDFQDLTEEGPIDPPVSGIPDYFDLVAPDGTKTRYVKAANP